MLLTPPTLDLRQLLTMQPRPQENLRSAAESTLGKYQQPGVGAPGFNHLGARCLNALFGVREQARLCNLRGT